MKMDVELFTAIGVLVAALAIILLWRTADGRYGKIQPSREATEAYEQFRAEDHLAYYVSGSDVYPTAIIGIDRTWTLNSDLWRPRDLSGGKMKELVQNMREKSAIRQSTLFGFDLFDHRGENIGSCYSTLDAVTIVKITGERTVVVYTPPVDTDRNP